MSRVLVIDDQNVPRMAVSGILENAGHEVLTASSGEEGLEAARTELPDVIVLDVYMPGMDGFEVVEQLKADQATEPTPVIFLTAEPPTDDLIVRGLELGAYDFLSKGCSRAELLARVGVMARIKRANDELSALARITDTLIQSLDRTKLSRRFLSQVKEVFRSDGVMLSYSASEDEPPQIHTEGLEADLPMLEALESALQKRLAGSESPQAEIAAEELSAAAGVMLRQKEVESVLAARVEHGRRTPTLIALFSRRPGGFARQSDQPLLELLARQATIALDNAVLHEQAQLQTEELERAMTERSRFFASMSHELRTPINAVIGYNELLALGAYGETTEEQHAAIERVSRSAQHLLELINDVLDISKIEAGKMEMNIEETNLGYLVRETVPTVEIQAENKGLEVNIETQKDAVVETDPARVRQILLNLLSNAVKFTEEGSVTVEVFAVNDGYAIRVSDTGPGIAPEDQERVFEEFEQTNGSPSTTGTGLGLPISKRLAHLLGGELVLESAVGEGSTFTLTLPHRPPPPLQPGRRE